MLLCRATLVAELVKGAEQTLREALGTDSGANVVKLNDAICTQLCEKGMEALGRATRQVGCRIWPLSNILIQSPRLSHTPVTHLMCV